MPLSALHGFADLGAFELVLLALCGLIGGIGITALGPGGVLVTLGLFALSGLPPAAVAGTAIVTHVGSGALGSGAYLRSGQLRESATRRVALVLILTAVVGTPLGVFANSHVSKPVFGALLGVCVIAIGVLVYLRERRLDTGREEARRPPPQALVAVIGFGVAAVSGLFGLGGPLLSVPLMLTAGVPMLGALGAAQAQSIVIAGTGTIGYLLQDAISWRLALVVGVPELIGVLLGWRLAHSLPIHRLRYGLAAVLVLLGPWLILHSA
jgi:uncharacterized protein